MSAAHLRLFLRLLTCNLIFLFACFICGHAQPFEKQMDVARAVIERRYGCECLACLPAITKTMQSASDRKIIAQGYRDIGVLLWYCNDRFSNGYANNLTASGALRYSLMFHYSPEVMAMLDSMDKPENGIYPDQENKEWVRRDSLPQGKTLAAAEGGGALLLETGEGEERLLFIKTDTGWIASGIPAEGWEHSGTLTYLKGAGGKPAALLVEYGENSYGSGGGTTWYNAFLLDLKTLRTVYSQSTSYSIEVFCGKYGEDPGCVRTPCAVEHPLDIKENRLVIGKVSRTQYQEGEDCSLGGITLSFINAYGEDPPGFDKLNIPVLYSLPGLPPGKYRFEKGYLFPAE